MAASTLLTSLSLFLTVCTSEHHMKRQIQPRQNGDGNNTPMIVSNWCADTIYPGVVTQGGTGPQNSGFELSPGDNQTLYVSSDWQGRIWGRTNCSFNDQGKPSGGNNGRACGSGDCGGALNCKVTGDTPVTLAEWTLDGGDGQTYYDISLVDGYNLPMAIVLLPPEGNSKFSADDIPPNLTNPSCIGSVGDLAGNTSDYNPYGSGDFLGTNSQNPLPFLTNVSASDVAQWCPWDLQVSPPLSPGDGVYPYPDSNIARPVFDPCYSACAKYNSDNYCCTGKYDGPDKCSPNYFSKAAKKICPDAYSFAYDDQTSTFIVPAGAGFQTVFCPGGLSTTILASKADQESQLQSQGSVSGGSLFSFGLKWLLIDDRTLSAIVIGFLAVLLVS